MEQGGDEEAVSWGFECARFAIRAAGNDGKARFHGAIFVFWIDLVIAEELFLHDLRLVERLQN